jgi:hypothetical protein
MMTAFRLLCCADLPDHSLPAGFRITSASQAVIFVCAHDMMFKNDFL